VLSYLSHLNDGVGESEGIRTINRW